MNTTYTAKWEQDGKVLYRSQPNGNLVGQMPLGTRPDMKDPKSTLDRQDGGDPWEYAIFITPSGRRIIVTKDTTPQT